MFKKNVNNNYFPDANVFDFKEYKYSKITKSSKSAFSQLKKAVSVHRNDSDTEVYNNMQSIATSLHLLQSFMFAIILSPFSISIFLFDLLL